MASHGAPFQCRHVVSRSATHGISTASRSGAAAAAPAAAAVVSAAGARPPSRWLVTSERGKRCAHAAGAAHGSAPTFCFPARPPCRVAL